MNVCRHCVILILIISRYVKDCYVYCVTPILILVYAESSIRLAFNSLGIRSIESHCKKA
jgi:hypothetical protein